LYFSEPAQGRGDERLTGFLLQLLALVFPGITQSHRRYMAHHPGRQGRSRLKRNLSQQTIDRRLTAQPGKLGYLSLPCSEPRAAEQVAGIRLAHRRRQRRRQTGDERKTQQQDKN